MKVINKKRAANYIKLFPDFVQQEVPVNEKNWKEMIFERLKLAIKEDKIEDIDFWLSNLDVFTGTEIYTYTIDEIEEHLKLLFNFIISSDHWKLVSQACQTFSNMYRPKSMKISIRFPWRPLYKIFQKNLISRSKTKRYSPPKTLLLNLITLTRALTYVFEENATEEILDLWLPLLEPHHHSLVLGHCLLCLFLPVNMHKEQMWFDKFFSIWPMFHAESWDYQWLCLFTRMSEFPSDQVDWEPYLPFFFNQLSRYLAIPLSPLDQTNITINDYQTDLYRIFYFGMRTVYDLIPNFTYVITNLLSHKCKEAVKKHLETTMYLVKHYCSPIAQADDDLSPDVAIIFINSIIVQYIKRVTSAGKTENITLPPLTEQDHKWFVDLILPLIQIERFCVESRIGSIKDFACLSPHTVVPALLATADHIIKYERLQGSAIKTVIALVPVCCFYDVCTFEIHDFIVKFAEGLDRLDIEQELRIFSLFSVYVASFGVKEEDEQLYLKVSKRAIDFIERLSESDHDQYGEIPTAWIGIACNALGKKFAAEIVDHLMKAVQHIQRYAVFDVIKSIGPNGREFIFPRLMEQPVGITKFAMLRGILKMDHSAVIDHTDEVLEVIKSGLDDPRKEIHRAACQCFKPALQNLLNIEPINDKVNGFTNFENAKIEWFIPGEKELAAVDKLCEAGCKWIEELFKGPEVRKKLTAVCLCANIAKGLKFNMSNSMFDVLEKDDIKTYPFLSPIDYPSLKKHWKFLLDILEQQFNEQAEEKVIIAMLKMLGIVLIPRDHVQVDSREEVTKVKSMKELLTIGLDEKAFTYRYITRKALQMFRFRAAVTFTPYTSEVHKIIQKSAPFCTHPNAKIRNWCALFIQETSAIFPEHFGPFFNKLISKAEEVVGDDMKLSGLSQALCSCCQLVFTASNFKIIAQAALLVCRPIINYMPEDSVRSLRHFISMTFDIIDFNEKCYTTPEFIETRREIINIALKRHDEFIRDREVESYSTALIISMAKDRPELLAPNVIKFLMIKLLSDDQGLRESIMQAVPFFVEHLIPRIPKKNRVNVDKVTPENYDNAIFKDRFLVGLSTTEPEFMTPEQLIDREYLAQYFPDPDNRIEIHKMLVNHFIDDNEFLDQICQSLVDSQVHQEESYSKMRVQFWVSILRLLGIPFIPKLSEQMEKLTAKNANIAMHVIAGELFSSIIFATKGWKWDWIEKIIPYILPFIARVVREGESDFQSVWFVSVVCGLSDHDPRRYWWLFDELIGVIPDHITQIRDVKTASLVVDILLEFAWRYPTIVPQTIDKAILPMFEKEAQQFEQIRECSIRAVSSLFSTFFTLENDEIPNEVRTLFDNVLSKAGDSFLVAWLTAQFTTQAMSSFVVNRLAIDKISEWLDICLGKTEDEEKKARGCLLHFIRSNWLWTCSSRPLTKETAAPVIQKIFSQLTLEKRIWQGQAVILFFNYAFFEVNYFFISDNDLEKLVNEIVMPAIELPNFDVQESAADVFTFLLKSSDILRNKIPYYVDYYRKLLFGGESTSKRIAGVKGLISIIQSTLFFDTVPDYITESFQMLTEAQQSNQTLEPHISQALSDFWAVHEHNLMIDVANQLEAFRDSVRPSYFC